MDMDKEGGIYGGNGGEVGGAMESNWGKMGTSVTEHE